MVQLRAKFDELPAAQLNEEHQAAVVAQQRATPKLHVERIMAQLQDIGVSSIDSNQWRKFKIVYKEKMHGILQLPRRWRTSGGRKFGVVRLSEKLRFSDNSMAFDPAISKNELKRRGFAPPQHTVACLFILRFEGEEIVHRDHMPMNKRQRSMNEKPMIRKILFFKPIR